MKIRTHQKFTAYLILSFVFTGNFFAQDLSSKIDSFMTALYNRGQFNGSVLVAVGGDIVYKNGFGKADFKKSIDYTAETPSYLASLTKQFTAMAIMMLHEQGKLSYKDKLSKYFSGFPSYADKVTIQQLLHHTSGIPDYFSLNAEHPGMTDEEVLKVLEKQDTLNFKPGDKFEYSNSGYVLLSLIIEKISGMKYREFLKKYIFEPLGMSNTFVYDKSFHNEINFAHAYNIFYGDYDNDLFTTGDGGIYSCVDELFKWDQALYTEKLVKKSALDEAFESGKLNDGSKTSYGFGWAVWEQDGKKFVSHAGELNGFNTYILRQMTDKYTIIFLTNIGGTQRKAINDAIYHIIVGKPYSFPKISAARAMYKIINESGWNLASAFYDSLKNANDSSYNYSEPEINLLGYQFLNENKVNDAINVFKLNTVAFPKSSNTFESLGEAYMKKNDNKLAIESFKKALEIDPNNSDAIKFMKQLGDSK